MQTLALPREILFHLLMNAPEGVPQGGSTSPLIRPTTSSAFMLWNNLLERGLPLQLDIPRSPAPGPVGCTAPPRSPSPLSDCPYFYNFLLISTAHHIAADLIRQESEAGHCSQYFNSFSLGWCEWDFFFFTFAFKVTLDFNLTSFISVVQTRSSCRSHNLEIFDKLDYWNTVWRSLRSCSFGTVMASDSI